MENLVQNLVNLSQPQKIEVGEDFIALDFSVNPSLIYRGNLPEDIFALIQWAEKIEYRSGSLYGYIGRQCIFSALCEYWSEEDLKTHAQYMKRAERKKPHFYINSLGGELNGIKYQYNDFKHE